MALNIFTNVSSLNAQRNLSITQASMSKSLQRLSSGLRINSASDDAAGLAISNGLESQSRGMDQASRNAGDALSLMGTAESAMEQQTSILQRMREIAVQASSDNNNNTNRSDINNEASQLKSELDRIAKTTQFNGLNLLDGTFQSKDMQVGANATGNDKISVSFSSTKAADIGAAYVSTSGSVTANALAGGDVTITVGTVTTSIGATVADGVSTAGATASALAKANAINAQTYLTGVTAQADTTFTGANAQQAVVFAAGDVQINGVDVGNGVTLTGANDGALVASINSKFAQTGVTATLDNTGHVVLDAADGRNIKVDIANTATAAKAGLGLQNTSSTNYGTITLRSTSAFTIGGANANANAGLTAGVVTQSTSQNVNAIDLTTKSGATLAIQIVDVALTQMNSRQAQIGALTNRLNTTISNLSAASQNAQASKSRIMDADFAAETANMSKNQVLQQAGIAILSQANQAPQQVLSLLR